MHLLCTNTLLFVRWAVTSFVFMWILLYFNMVSSDASLSINLEKF